MSQPSATSRPAVRHRPWQIASVGIGSASRRWTGPTSDGKPSPASAASLKIWTSTPAEKTSPSARHTAARTSEFSISRDAFLQLVERAGGEEVEVAVRKRDDADVAVPGIRDRGHQLSPLIVWAVALISSGSPGRGIHGSSSGSSWFRGTT